MNGRLAKKIRRLLRKSEAGLAARVSAEFKVFVRALPLRSRVALAFKILRKTI